MGDSDVSNTTSETPLLSVPQLKPPLAVFIQQIGLLPNDSTIVELYASRAGLGCLIDRHLNCIRSEHTKHKVIRILINLVTTLEIQFLFSVSARLKGKDDTFGTYSANAGIQSALLLGSPTLNLALLMIFYHFSIKKKLNSNYYPLKTLVKNESVNIFFFYLQNFINLTTYYSIVHFTKKIKHNDTAMLLLIICAVASIINLVITTCVSKLASSMIIKLTEKLREIWGYYFPTTGDASHIVEALQTQLSLPIALGAPGALRSYVNQITTVFNRPQASRKQSKSFVSPRRPIPSANPTDDIPHVQIPPEDSLDAYKEQVVNNINRDSMIYTLFITGLFIAIENNTAVNNIFGERIDIQVLSAELIILVTTVLSLLLKF